MPLAFLTGGGSVIGEGITRALVARGWHVAVTDINHDLAQAGRRRGRRMPHAEALALDATDRARSTPREGACSPAMAASTRWSTRPAACAGSASRRPISPT